MALFFQYRHIERKTDGQTNIFNKKVFFIKVFYRFPSKCFVEHRNKLKIRLGSFPVWVTLDTRYPIRVRTRPHLVLTYFKKSKRRGFYVPGSYFEGTHQFVFSQCVILLLYLIPFVPHVFSLHIRDKLHICKKDSMLHQSGYFFTRLINLFFVGA